MKNNFKVFYFNFRLNIKIKFILFTLPKQLLLSARYINGGKNLRSQLMYQTAKLIEVPTNKILVSAACLEILHTASLIHDDVIDGDAIRRGSKTLNHTLSQRQAIMIGNYLLLRNFYQLFKRYLKRVTLRIDLINGIEKLCNGEIMQGLVYNFHTPPSLKECLHIAAEKTGTLFGLSCKLPFLVLKSSPEQALFAENCGLTYGIIYQIMDDLSDMKQDLQFNKKKIFFKHWTMPFFFWQKLYPKNFTKTFKQQKMLLTNAMKTNITQKCISQIEILLKKLQFESQVNSRNQKFYKFILSNVAQLAKKKQITLKNH